MKKPARSYTVVNIDKELHRLLKMAAVMTGMTQKEIVEAALEEYMKRRAGLDHLLKAKEE